MAKSSDQRLKILIIAFVVVIAGVVIAAVLSSQDSTVEGATPQMSIASKYFDFETISMANGDAKHIFTIENKGDGDLKLTNISTSCMCTTAILEVDGKKSPLFGMHNNSAFWSQNLKPGQSASLEVIFDPLAHGPDAVGPITRAVTMFSNDGGQQSVKTVFTITADVVK